jgi:hypothetical protein
VQHAAVEDDHLAAVGVGARVAIDQALGLRGAQARDEL